MTLIPIVIFVLALTIGLGSVLLRRRPFAEGDRNPKPADQDWIDHFSVARYRPMERLLSERDLVFLKCQPGYKPYIERQLRQRRLRIFACYLNQLIADFDRLHAAAVQSAISSPVDRPELAAELIRKQATFKKAVFIVRLRLALSSVGVSPGDVRPLVEAVRALSAGVREQRHVPAAAPSPAV